MDHGEVALIHDHAQPAEYALEDHGREDGIGEVAHPAAWLGTPGDGRKGDREHPDDRGGEAVDVFVNDAADPVIPGEGEHVIAEAVGPVGDRHAGVVGGDEAADEDEREVGASRDDGQGV